jgi:predicted acylesterase/phospholipase RssA/CRP-like cAMP-binding protein
MTAESRREVQRELLKDVLPALFGTLDEETLADLESQFEWRDLAGGSYLFRQGDAGDSMFILVSGRLQVIAETADGGETILGEVGRGESVGEIALVTEDARSASIRAIRDSVLVEIARKPFLDAVERHPQVAMNLATEVILRLRDRTSGNQSSRGTVNIALVPVGPESRLEEFSVALAAAMELIGPTLLLTRETVEILSGVPDAAQVRAGSVAHARVTAWLDQQESKHKWVLYQAEPQACAWTRRCLRQADLILLVGDATSSPSMSQLEAQLLSGDSSLSRAERQLILLHPTETPEPTGTEAWLAARDVTRHFHLRRGDEQHMARIARCLTGNALGLVLGGGAARGFAHIGVFRALAEFGIPVDFVGGSSIGAVMGAAIAHGWDPEEVEVKSRQAFVVGNPFSDYTLPLISILKGRKLERLTQEHFSGNIEDLWLPFFCVSSNLSNADVVVYERGSVARAIRASVAIPGVFPPAVEENHLLIDGGILNNLPIDLMRQRINGHIIAVDLKVRKEYQLQYVKVPSPWKVLRSRLLPFAKRLPVPSLTTIVMKATEMGSIVHLTQYKGDADLYMNPPVGKFGITDIKAFDQIVQVGYNHARESAIDWLEERSRKGDVSGLSSTVSPFAAGSRN